MINFRKLLYLLLLVSPKIFANGWQSLGYGLSQYAQTIYVDSANNKIYAGGAFYEADSVRAIGVAVWDGSHWDSLGAGQVYGQYNFAITKYQNQIYSDGRFILHGLDNFGGRFNNTSWDSMSRGVSGPIYQFREINGLLWVGGFFDSVDGNPCNMLATWDGNSWNCLGVPYHINIEDFLFYNNQLIIGGNFVDSSGNNIDLAYSDGTNFDVLGHPIFGAVSYIHCMAIYNGDLYVAGYFSQTAGNEGENIMRWDGSQWHNLGVGTDNSVLCMTVYNGELYVGGTFDYAGGMHTGNLAKWNGSQWDEVASSIISPGINDIQFYNNEMYIAGGFHIIDSIPVNYIAKYSGPLSVDENSLSSQINIYPNPGKNYLQINSFKFKIEKIKISDVLSKEIYSRDNSELQNQIDISFLKSGIYFLILETKEGRVVKKFVKE